VDLPWRFADSKGDFRRYAISEVLFQSVRTLGVYRKVLSSSLLFKSIAVESPGFMPSPRWDSVSRKSRILKHIFNALFSKKKKKYANAFQHSFLSPSNIELDYHIFSCQECKTELSNIVSQYLLSGFSVMLRTQHATRLKNCILPCQ